MNDISKKISDLIISERALQRITNKEIAEKSSLSANATSTIANTGKGKIENIEAVLNALGYKLDIIKVSEDE